MQRLPQDELRGRVSRSHMVTTQLDNQTALRSKKKLAEEFRNQLTFGVPTNSDEAGCGALPTQLKAGQLVVKLFPPPTRFTRNFISVFVPTPTVLLLAILQQQFGRSPACRTRGIKRGRARPRRHAKTLPDGLKIAGMTKWCVDIFRRVGAGHRAKLGTETPLPPYYIYVKMAYHLAQEARRRFVGIFASRQNSESLVLITKSGRRQIAAHHLNKRNGVLIGDVVGLGKTLMASALAKNLSGRPFHETLIICPKNLVKMWEDHVSEYRLLAKVLSVTKAVRQLPTAVVTASC